MKLCKPRQLCVWCAEWNSDLCHASLNECVGFLISFFFEKDIQYLCCSCYMYHHANDNWPIGQYQYTCIMMFIEGSYL